MKFAILFPTIIFLMVSCSTAKLLRDFDTNPVPEGLSLSKVAKAIKLAGLERGWVFKKNKGENVLTGYLTVRTHNVAIEIPYTRSNYEILYVSSENMNHSGNYIHRSYFKWVLNLKKQIDSQLVRLSLRE